MQRVLIADSSYFLAEELKRLLKGAYEIEICHDGIRALELIHQFEPDLLVLDFWLPHCDGLDLLQNLRCSGNAVKVIALMRNLPNSVGGLLDKLGVSYAFQKPCMATVVAARINQLCMQSENEEKAGFCIDNEIVNLLLRLGFSIGASRFKCVYNAILLAYRSRSDMLWKWVYPEVARICGGTAARVEKAIRDARNDAFRHGDPRVWELYFPAGKSGMVECPSNESFVLRMVAVLENNERLKRPYLPNQDCAQ